MCRTLVSGSIVLVCLAALLGACSGLPELGSPVATYGAANVFTPVGYSQTKIDDTHYQVKAMGTEATPRGRVEKLARTRAAQIGIDNQLAYFKVTNVQHAVSCSERQRGYKSSSTPAQSRPTVVLDVEYAKEAADPTFARSEDAFAALSTELENDVVPPDAKAVAIQEVRASCGQG